ncbi:MAG: GIY-YIG nuclease family protein [Balneolaceae bacterium]|nr:GIY-YIG nuclease family protein [Balneolaceae bacterium]
MDYFLYILQSEIKETYYIGSSDNPQRRLPYHNAESKGYTQRYRPWKLVYTHPFDTKQKALKAEQIVKKWKSKKMIRLLIDGKISIHDYLE